MSKKGSIKSFLPLALIAAAATAASAFKDVSWWASFWEACAVYFIWTMNDELQNLRKSFFIADAELVRVSALANELHGEVLELRYKVAELECAHEIHEH